MSLDSSITLFASGPVTSISVSLASSSLAVGDTTVATATLLSSSGRVRRKDKPRWSSANPAVAVVDSIRGVVRAVAVGATMIIASVDDVSGQAALTVVVDSVPSDTTTPPPPPPDTTTPPPPPDTTTPPPPPPSAARVLFNSDWSTATGISREALSDASKPLPWTIVGGEGLEVIPSTGLDFPTTNALRVTVTQARAGFAFLRKEGMPIPAVGESRYYRWYTRVVIRDGLAVTDPETHPHQDGTAFSVSNWLFHIYHDAGTGRWLPQFRPNTAANTWPGIRWSGPALLKNVTYRFEVQIHRTGTSTFQMHIRVYNSAGALIHTDADFRHEQGVSLATNPTFRFHDVNSMNGLNAGLNGLSGSDWYPSTVYMYQAGVQVCADTWCGPYAR